jgi:hypothetical protein
MQWYLQKQHLQQNLYDKRFRVFMGLRTYLCTLTDHEGHLSDLSAYNQFHYDTDPALFLFGHEVTTYLKHIDDIAMTLVRRTAQIEIDTLAPTSTLAPDSKPTLELQLEAQKILVELYHAVLDGMYTVFRPYLQLHYEQRWLVRFIARVNQWVDQDQPAALASRYDA